MKDRNAIRGQVQRLLAAYKAGRLGGEKMPEDENPHLDPASGENYLYFTLPMALNYQRNSYRLWSRGGFTADINDEPQQAQKGNHHGK